MQKVVNFWNFLDGKKTVIGAALSVAGQALALFPSTAAVGVEVSKAGAAIAAGGLFHKILK